ncbi:coiled-coil domain-containing protein 24 [Antennarius striatus]|uniref:coiled-coil domain-containing protein 24 n=1 Tax=Antennarius striatus TaxID=241820 RepID=UPI0035B2300D
MQSPVGQQLWCPSKSLWSLIAEHVPTPELPKIRRTLDNSLIDMYTAEYSQAVAWYKIWQEVQEKTNRRSSVIPHRPCPPLADPPAVKELVRAEVKMLLQTLRERAGRDAEALILHYKPAVVDYALGHRDSCHRIPKECKDTDTGSRPSSVLSLRSSAEEEIEAIKEKLNIFNIDAVVVHLKSLLTEECKALKHLIKDLKRNILDMHLGKCDESEPTLVELRDLREAIQMQLQLCPSLSAESPSPSPVLPSKELKNTFRPSAGQRETLQTEHITSVVRPRPPSPLCHTKPRPPLTTCTSNTPPSIKRINRYSLSLTHGQHTSASPSTGLRAQTPASNSIVSPGRENISCSVPRPVSAPIIRETRRYYCPSPEKDSAGLQRSTKASNHSFQMRTSRIPTVTHQTSHHSLSRKCDSSPQMERNSCRNINTIGSLVPAISLCCDADSYRRFNTNHSVNHRANRATE